MGLEFTLNSSVRLVYWKRTFNTDDYDFDKIGWNYIVEAMALDDETYDPSLTGYSNSEHLYGDILTEEERTALLEYLKTL